jgi:hypothetical protein
MKTITTIDGKVLHAAENAYDARFLELRGKIDQQIRNAFFGGWPEDYQPGNGFSGTLRLEDIVPPRCDKIIGDRPTS